jgi:hypothetical protein
MNDCFQTVLDEFKANESPESVLVVGDDPNLVKVVLAWPNVPVWHVEEAPPSPKAGATSAGGTGSGGAFNTESGIWKTRSAAPTIWTRTPRC